VAPHMPAVTGGEATRRTREQSETCRSKVLGERRHINVYLPPGYAGSRSAGPQVLFMPDSGIGEDFLHGLF
jgi:hypothetical protein